MVGALDVVSVDAGWFADAADDEVGVVVSVEVADGQGSPAAAASEAEVLGGVGEVEVAAVVVGGEPLGAGVGVDAFEAAAVVAVGGQHVVEAVSVEVANALTFRLDGALLQLDTSSPLKWAHFLREWVKTARTEG